MDARRVYVYAWDTSLRGSQASCMCIRTVCFSSNAGAVLFLSSSCFVCSYGISALSGPAFCNYPFASLPISCALDAARKSLYIGTTSHPCSSNNQYKLNRSIFVRNMINEKFSGLLHVHSRRLLFFESRSVFFFLISFCLKSWHISTFGPSVL